MGCRALDLRSVLVSTPSAPSDTVLVLEAKDPGALVFVELVTSRHGLLLGLFVATTAACAAKEDVTPTIVVSPGAKERIMVMDRFRHHGSPRRLLPRVSVEEVDDSELPSAPEETTAPSTTDATTFDGDAGAPEPDRDHAPAPGGAAQ